MVTCSFAADVRQKATLDTSRTRSVREAKFRGSGRGQNLLGFLNKHFMILDDFGPRQGSGRSGRFSGLPDRALETSRHDRPRRESRQDDRGRQRTTTTTMIVPKKKVRVGDEDDEVDHSDDDNLISQTNPRRRRRRRSRSARKKNAHG